jgi:hypothetical protein
MSYLMAICSCNWDSGPIVFNPSLINAANFFSSSRPPFRNVKNSPIALFKEPTQFASSDSASKQPQYRAIER